MKPSLIVLGAPGSGKGTQADKISKLFGYLHLSTGDLLRSEIERKTDVGIKVQDIMAKGNLVSDELVLDLLKARFSDRSKAYILDGFPRNKAQAEMLTEQLSAIGCDYKAVFFNVDLNLLKSRIVNRRTCKKCGEIYNLITKPLDANGNCNNCGASGEIVHRKDDTEEVVENRLKVFREANDPIVSYYRSKNLLIELNAQQSEDEVFEDFKKIINSL